MKEIVDNFKAVFLSNYANFSGRADRTEMWLFQAVLYTLFQVIYLMMYPFIILFSFASAFSQMHGSSTYSSMSVLVIYLLFFIASLPFFIPSLALSVRRLHDTNRSGWNLLFAFIPFIGGLYVMLLLAIDGQRGANKYGEDPKVKRYSMTQSGN